MSSPEETLFTKANYDCYLELGVNSTGTNITNCIDKLGLRLDHNGYIRWKTDSPDHPRNWSVSRKTFDTVLIFMLDLFTTAISTAGPSVAEKAKVDYNLSRTVALVAFASMYQFGQAFGGIVFPPYSEAFGRKSVYISSSLLYCISCIVVGVVPSVAAAAAGRFVSGIMSAVPSVVVSGSVEDMYNMKHRVWLMFVWACATTLGLLIGPIYGSYISTTIGWRWVFYTAAMITAIFTILLSFIHESRPSKLLSDRLARLKRNTGISDFRIQNPDATPNLQTFAQTTLIRPVRLFFTEPIVFLVSVMSAVVWALIYMFTESLPVIYREFGLSREQSSLLFIAIALGMAFGAIPRIHDRRVLQRRQAANLSLHPEDKLIGFAFAAPTLAFGLWWLVLTTPPASTLPWYATIVGLIPIGFAINEFACTLSGYLADTYTIYTSSALAALAFLRAILAGLFPLVGEPMYVKLGLNWASVVLACIATVFCVTPILVIGFGKGIRQRSAFAKYSLMVNGQTQIEDENVK